MGNDIENKSSQIEYPADKAFELHDTYGFPIEIIQEMCKEKGFFLDMDKFNALMEEHKEMSRKGMFKNKKYRIKRGERENV